MTLITLIGELPKDFVLSGLIRVFSVIGGKNFRFGGPIVCQ
jgi:hypothetical protein